MNSATLACPYCNAQVAATPGMSAGQRVQCPRCGQVFTLESTPETGIVANAPGFPTPPEPPRPARSNARIAAWVLGLMGSMAAIGLAFALWTTRERRAHDTGVPHVHRPPLFIEPPETPVTPLAPALWPALGYLPTDTNLVAGVRMAELRKRKDGRALLDASVKIGPVKFRLDQVAEKTGLRLEQIDQIVVGLRVEHSKKLPLALVIRTRQPYGDHVQAQLTRAKPTESDGKTLYPLDLLGLPQVLWLADNRTLVIALTPRQLATVPATPAKNLDQLVPPLRTILKRLFADSPVWIAGDPQDWSNAATDLILTRLPPQQKKLLQSVQTFAVWVGPEDKQIQQIQLDGAFHCKTVADVDRLATELNTLLGKESALKTAPDKTWLSAQLRLDPDTLRNWLQR